MGGCLSLRDVDSTEGGAGGLTVGLVQGVLEVLGMEAVRKVWEGQECRFTVANADEVEVGEGCFVQFFREQDVSMEGRVEVMCSKHGL